MPWAGSVAKHLFTQKVSDQTGGLGRPGGLGKTGGLGKIIQSSLGSWPPADDPTPGGSVAGAGTLLRGEGVKRGCFFFFFSSGFFIDF